MLYIKKNSFTQWLHVVEKLELSKKETSLFMGDFNGYIGLGVPRTIVIGKNGKVVYKGFGYSAEEMENLKLLVDRCINNGF
jgi:hypothetical protein